VPGSRREGAVPEGQVETVGTVEKVRILYWWPQARDSRDGSDTDVPRSHRETPAREGQSRAGIESGEED
jgi:hypothetical protein